VNIVLLAHSHVGNGVFRAISRVPGAKLVLAVGYGKTETLVPAPNLVRDWRERGINTAVIIQKGKPPWDEYPVGDILISANWRHKIPESYFSRFPLAVNFHGCNTLLHSYRGRRPIQRQIEDRKKTYFLTCHRLAEQYDAGEILAQSCHRFAFVPSELMVYGRMGEMAYDLTLWILDNWNALGRNPT
jgi:hypothetical protein